MNIKAIDRGFAALQLLLGIYIVIQSWQYGLTDRTGPGTGLFPFVAGLALAVLAASVLLRKKENTLCGEIDKAALRMILALTAVIALFIAVVEFAGFTLSCLFLMLVVGYVCQEPETRTREYYTKLGASTLGTCLVCHIFFGSIIGTPLPKSFLGF